MLHILGGWAALHGFSTDITVSMYYFIQKNGSIFTEPRLAQYKALGRCFQPLAASPAVVIVEVRGCMFIDSFIHKA